MTQVIITRKTRKRLLLAASSGQPISPADFGLTWWNSELQEELARVAKLANNVRFFESRENFLANLKLPSKPKPPSQIRKRIQRQVKLSPEYNPTGMTCQEFLEKKGLCKPPRKTIRFVSGGAVDSNRRRH